MRKARSAFMGQVARQTIRGSIANYLGVVIGFVNILILLPLIFSETEVGIIKMLTENMVMLAGFALMGVTTSMYRYYPHFKNDPKGKDHGFDFWALFIPFLGFLALCLLLILGRGWVVAYFNEKAAVFLSYYLLLLPLAFTQVFFSVFEVAVAIEGRIVVPKILKEIVLRVLTAIAFFSYYFQWLTFDESVLLLLVFYFLILFVLIAYFGSLRKLNLRPDLGFLKQNPAIVKDFFGYTAMVTIGSISGVLLTKLDFIMISGKIGVDATGVYAIAFHVATAIEIPQRALTQLLSPKVSELMKEGQHVEAEDLYKRTSVVLFLPALLLLLAVLSNLDNLYELMPNGSRYSAGKTVILIIAGAKCLEMMSGMGQFILLYSKYYSLMFIMTIGSLIVGIFMNLWLIPIYGITGAALATASTMFLQQLFVVSIIYLKFRFHSFTPALFKALFLFLGVFGLHFILPSAPTAWLDLFFRGAFLPGLLLTLLYALRISPEINQQVDRLLQLIKRK